MIAFAFIHQSVQRQVSTESNSDSAENPGAEADWITPGDAYFSRN